MPTDPTITALEQQVTCYQRLAKLAEIQHEHVQNSRTEELLNVLGQRQVVLDRVGELERIIAPNKRRWSDYLVGLPTADRGRAESLLAATRSLLEKITTADRDDALVLQQRKLNLGRELCQANTARQVNRSYAAAAYGRRSGGMDLKK
jgi:hypothetical protein